jgi:hypothetical protein
MGDTTISHDLTIEMLAQENCELRDQIAMLEPYRELAKVALSQGARATLDDRATRTHECASARATT